MPEFEDDALFGKKETDASIFQLEIVTWQEGWLDSGARNMSWIEYPNSRTLNLTVGESLESLMAQLDKVKDLDFSEVILNLDKIVSNTVLKKTLEQ